MELVIPIPALKITGPHNHQPHLLFELNPLFPFFAFSHAQFKIPSILISFESEMRYLIFSGRPSGGRIFDSLIPALFHFLSIATSSSFHACLNALGKIMAKPFTNSAGL